jgi:hypothetical protein
MQINRPTNMSTIKILRDGNIHVHIHVLALEAGLRPTHTYPIILPEVDLDRVQFLQRRNVGVETQAL